MGYLKKQVTTHWVDATGKRAPRERPKHRKNKPNRQSGTGSLIQKVRNSPSHFTGINELLEKCSRIWKLSITKTIWATSAP
ncbi:MAG: hypothetical protein DWH95_06960 [Planctomycetota bacterium]|nr:MAG: hypothetical protein DWH95_06960 [Planctomycetota bacterium]